MLNHFKTNFSKLITYGTFKFLSVLILLMAYFAQITAPDSLLSFIYALTLPSYYYIFVFLVVFLLAPFYFIPYARYLYVVVFFLIDFYLLVDVLVCNVYRFHLNQTLINMFFFDLKGIGIPTYILVLALFLALILFLANIWLFRWSVNRSSKYPIILFPLFISIFVFNQGIHIGASGFNDEGITKYTPYFPFFYPTTSSKTIKKLSKYFPDLVPANGGSENKDLLKSISAGTIQYPLKSLECNISGEKYDILFFIAESWRSDMMNEAITPNIHKLSKQSYVYNNHMSGGNATVPGLFSLMYGLHPTYLKNIQASPSKYPPFFMEILKENRYESHIYTSSNLTRFSLREMFFNEREYENYTYIEDESHDKDDRNIIDAVTKSIRTDKWDKPAFRFIFLTSSHHKYDYPAEHKIFTPVSNNAAFMLNKQLDANPYLNDYKNSLHYVDALFGEVMEALEESNKLNKTIIVVTSDHGEEFNDNGTGYWGHGSNFTRSQISVPLVMYLPDNSEEHLIDKRSGHIDIVPTLINHSFKCDADFTDYSSGLSLMDLPEHRSLIAGSYINNAYIIDDVVYSREFGINSYDLDNMNNKNEDFNYEAIRSLLSEEIHFIKNNKDSS